MRRVHYNYWQTHYVHPDCLKRIEHCEPQSITLTILELLISTYVIDSVNEVAGEPDAPEAHERSHHELATVVTLEVGASLPEEEGQQGYDNKVGPASEVSHFVVLEQRGYGEEQDLHRDRHHGADSEVVPVYEGLHSVDISR